MVVEKRALSKIGGLVPLLLDFWLLRVVKRSTDKSPVSRDRSDFTRKSDLLGDTFAIWFQVRECLANANVTAGER